MSLKKLFLSFSILITSAIAHSTYGQNYSCSCADDIDQFAPIPEQALGVNVTASGVGYVTEELGGGAYVVYSGTHQALFLVTGDGVIAVDNPASLGVNLQYAIANVTDEPVKKFIYSHSHNDHVGGAGIFAASGTNTPANETSSANSTSDNAVEYIAHAETDVLLRAVPPLATNNRPLPDTTFTTTFTVTLGNQTVELAYYGPNHQPGNIFIYVPDSKILMLVDIIYPGWAPFLDLALADFVPGYVHAHDIVLAEYDFDVFIGGHYNRVGDRADVEAAREYVGDLRDSCRRVLQAAADGQPVDISDVAAQNPGNILARGAAITERAAELCAEPVREKWLGVLAGVDAVVVSHAARMIFGLRIEYGEFA